MIRRLVPNFIIQKYNNNELRGSLEGAAIFVDLVGFSKMVDALSAHGQPGAETLPNLCAKSLNRLWMPSTNRADL